MEGEKRAEERAKKNKRKRSDGKEQQQRQELKAKVRGREDLRGYSKIKSLALACSILRKTKDHRSEFTPIPSLEISREGLLHLR